MRQITACELCKNNLHAVNNYSDYSRGCRPNEYLKGEIRGAAASATAASISGQNASERKVEARVIACRGRHSLTVPISSLLAMLEAWQLELPHSDTHSYTTGFIGRRTGSVAAELPGSVGVEQLGVRVRGVGDHRSHCVGHLLPLRAHA